MTGLFPLCKYYSSYLKVKKQQLDMVAGYLIDNHYSSSEKNPKVISPHISTRNVSHQGHCLMSQTLWHQSPLPPADLGRQSKQSFCATIEADD